VGDKRQIRRGGMWNGKKLIIYYYGEKLEGVETGNDRTVSLQAVPACPST
jgi:hypothetical protein